MTTILYIAGYGRSGSTLLDMYLGMNGGVIGMGELTHVLREWRDDASCSCGTSFRHCSFWQAVFAQFQQMTPDIPVADAVRISRAVEKNPLGYKRGLGGKLTQQQLHYQRIWSNLVAAISSISQAHVIVDSSKSARLVTSRAAALQRVAQLETKVIHLVRDPRAVMWSYLRGNNLELAKGNAIAKQGGAYRMLLSWVTTNVGVHWLARNAQLPVIRVRYEDFVADPKRTVARIGDHFGLTFDNLGATTSATPSALDAAHGVAGNRIRRAGVQPLKLDNEWEGQLRPALRKMALLSWPLMQAYGYVPPTRQSSLMQGARREI
ncbi:MAG: sulfotransferase [Caldilineaceae bacterium]